MLNYVHGAFEMDSLLKKDTLGTKNSIFKNVTYSTIGVSILYTIL